jgi:hypothetical protein
MKTLATLAACLLVALCASAQMYKTGWTSTTNPATARAALGISETNAIGMYVTNTFAGDTLTIGTGTNAVIIQATGGNLVGTDAALAIDMLSVNALALGGVTKTAWPTNAAYSGGIKLYTSYFTNLADVAGLTNLGYFSNGWYEAKWISTNGSVLEIKSSGDGVTWAQADATTNATYLGIFVSLSNIESTNPPAVSNLIIRSVSDLSALGETNDYRGTVIIGDEPTDERGLTPKSYVDGAAASAASQWATYKPVGNVDLNGKTLILDSIFTWATGFTNNQRTLEMQQNGNAILSLSAMASTGTATNVTLKADNTGSNLLFTIAKAGTTNAPTIQTRTNVTTGTWGTLALTATNTSGGDWLLSASYPATSPSFYRAVLTFTEPLEAKINASANLAFSGTKTLEWGATNAAPSDATPDAWVRVLVGTNTYLMPLYTP